MEVLKPYRVQLDDLDREILDLLKQRFDIIDQVKVVKQAENIPAVLQDRVDEVRENAASYAVEIGLDEDFIRQFWAMLIAESCDREDRYFKAAE